MCIIACELLDKMPFQWLFKVYKILHKLSYESRFWFILSGVQNEKTSIRNVHQSVNFIQYTSTSNINWGIKWQNYLEVIACVCFKVWNVSIVFVECSCSSLGCWLSSGNRSITIILCPFHDITKLFQWSIRFLWYPPCNLCTLRIRFYNFYLYWCRGHWNVEQYVSQHKFHQALMCVSFTSH